LDLGPVESRKAVDEVQSGGIAKPDVEGEWDTVDGSPDRPLPPRLRVGASRSLPTLPAAEMTTNRGRE
jgi:hypothetical protein